jgi:hypothetical protein
VKSWIGRWKGRKRIKQTAEVRKKAKLPSLYVVSIAAIFRKRKTTKTDFYRRANMRKAVRCTFNDLSALTTDVLVCKPNLFCHSLWQVPEWGVASVDTLIKYIQVCHIYRAVQSVKYSSTRN